MTDKAVSPQGFFARSPVLLRITLAVIFILGFGIRLYDLTDPPLDFHATRQLFSALIARGMYYRGLDSAPEWQRAQAADALQAKPVIEPRIFETVVALTYRVIGAEAIWVARIYAALFWVLGGAALYYLARDMTSPDGGVIAATFYLFVPFGAIASRSFQPDPLMVMWIVIAWWAFYRWCQSPSWKAAIVAGLAAGAAILVKSVAVFMLLGGMAALLLSDRGLKNAIRDAQVWGIAALSALPVSIFMLYGLVALEMSSQFKGRFFPDMLTDPTHYIRWIGEMSALLGFSGLIAGLVGVFAFRKRPQRAFLMGLWGGYVVFGLFFPYHFLTHDYYHLPLIPLAALSLAPVAAAVFRRIASLDLGAASRLAVAGVLVLGVAVQLWNLRVTLAREDYRHEPAYWEAIGEAIDGDAEIVALTQDYGDRLAYYGRVNVTNWPDTGHMKYRDLRGAREMTFDEWFAKHTAGMDYFLVTRLKEFARQGNLYARLNDSYAIVAEGEGYLLFDLSQVKQP